MIKKTGSLKFNFCYLISTFFFVGLTPVFPGTTGSFVCVIITFFLPTSNLFFNFVMIFLLFGTGLVTSRFIEKTLHIKDPSWIVIDEVCAMFLCLCWLPKNWLAYLIVFALFRFFDIVKLYPTDLAEALKAPGWGVMLDDLVAAVYTIITFLIIELIWFGGNLCS